MNTRTILCGLLVLTCEFCHAESQMEQAKMPYALIYKIATAEFKQLEGLKKQESRLIISSTLPNVKPKDIKLYIDSRSGKIPLRLNSDGTFSFPLRKDLLKENPFVIANQPKGSMQLEAKIDLHGNIKTKGRVVSGKHKIRYIDLFSIRTMQEQVVDQITGDVRDYVDYVHPHESITWSEFRPTKPIESPVVIYGRSGNIKVGPDPDGVVRIKYDPKLAKENPFVTFPSDGQLEVFSKLMDTEK